MFDYFHKRPYNLYTVVAVCFIVGWIAWFQLPKNMFPDVTPPEVVVVTQVPGATAQVAANTVSKPIEEELARLGMVTDISSTSAANLSIVKVEFDYAKGLDPAVNDVLKALSIASRKLPESLHPAIYTVGDFTLPVDVFSLSPKDSTMSLGEIREVAESYIKPYLLTNHQIGDVEVYGGYQSSINIEVDPYKAKAYNVDFATLAKALQTLNHDMPVGFLKGENDFYTITFYGERNDIQRLKQLNVLPNVKLSDIASVSWGYDKRMSGYLGNGKPAIAIAVERAPGGTILEVSNAARKAMKHIEKLYPNINVSISSTQHHLIHEFNHQIFYVLLESILLMFLVIIFFTSNLKLGVVLPIHVVMVLLTFFALIWIAGASLNIVVYIALIIGLAMSLNNVLVVRQNIERHLMELKEDLNTAVRMGTKEVISPLLFQTLETVAIVSPLLFVGGLPQKLFQPPVLMIFLVLFISWFYSFTIVPEIMRVLYKKGLQKSKTEEWMEDLYQKLFTPFLRFFIKILQYSNSKHTAWRTTWLTLGVLLVLILSYVVVISVEGRDAMPPMDTGIINAQVKFSANESVNSAEARMQPFLDWLHKQSWVSKSSVAFGNELGDMSLGSGNLPSEATITIDCVDRYHRKQSIWQLESIIREKISQLEGVKQNDVFDFGATSVSTIKAPLDVRLTSPILDGMSSKSFEIKQALQRVPGLTSLSTSWQKDFTEIVLNIDENKALSYGITPYQIAMQIPVRGDVVGVVANLSSLAEQPVRLYLKGKFGSEIQSIRLLPIDTPMGEVPLVQLATVSTNFTYAKIERDQLMYSVDINGYRSVYPESKITADARHVLKNVNLNGESQITQQGDIVEINDSTSRLLFAVALSIIIIFITLIFSYRSVKMPLIMLTALPLAFIGMLWGLFFLNKAISLPTFVGMLILFRITIKDARTFMDLYQSFKSQGKSPFDSAVEAVSKGFRFLMLGTFLPVAAVLPIVFEQAVGIDRLSPLACVLVGGMLIGGFLMLMYLPMYVYMADSKKWNKEHATDPKE
jgi:multidrug efflux pump subunit AcrB